MPCFAIYGAQNDDYIVPQGSFDDDELPSAAIPLQGAVQ